MPLPVPFIKSVKTFSGYYGCDKCEQKVKWVGKMTFPEVNATARTDQRFFLQSNEEHHTGISPFVHAGVGMVSQFPIDYMHLVCLGVTKRMLLMWIKGPLDCRIGPRAVDEISTSLTNLKTYIPSEFARKPRPLTDIDRWKATELRQFLLYSGPVVLKHVIHSNMYKNFMLLSTGIHFLLNENLNAAYNQYAKELLEAFVKHFYELYGYDQAVYNVHALVHLANDASKFGTLDNTSSFPYENFLHRLKRLVRKPEFPLQQVIRRLSEQTEKTKDVNVVPTLHKEHSVGPILPQLTGATQYQKLKTRDYTLRLDRKDSCVMIGENICCVKNIVKQGNDVSVIYQKFKQEGDFFNLPLPSRSLGIKEVSGLGNTYHVTDIKNIKAKCVLLNHRGKNVAFPLCGAIWSETKFAIVEFVDNSEVEVVPHSWIKDNGTKCHWPNYKSTTKLQTAVRQSIFPNQDFEKWNIKIMYETSDYNKARQKLSQAVYHSDLQTEEEGSPGVLNKRKRRPNQRYESTTDEESEEDSHLNIATTSFSKQEKKTEAVRKSPRKAKLSRHFPSPERMPTPPSPYLQLQSPPRPQPLSSDLVSQSGRILEKLSASIPISTATSRFQGFEVKLLTCMEQMKMQVNQNTMLLQSILTKLDGVKTSDQTENDVNVQLPSLPLRTMNELDELETAISDEDVKKQMVRSLSTIGGNDLKQTVRRLLSNVLENTVALELNWRGKGSKKPFSSLRLKDVILKTVRQNRICSQATDKEIEDIIKDWQRYAADRNGGRKKRNEQKQAASNTNE